MHPVLIGIAGFKISTYGVLVAAGYMLAILWLKSQIRFMPNMDEDRFWALVYALFFGAILGGKILYVAVSWDQFASDPWSIIRDFRYGFVFFGGLIGAVLMGLWAKWKLRIDFMATADFVGVALPMGHAVGRLGCLAAGCCYGKPTSLPWAVRLGGPASSTPEALWGVPLHPTQLYESIANAAIALLLLKYALPLAKKKRLAPGTVFLAYVILYSIARFVNEFFRGDDRGWSYAGLWVSQWVALGGIIVAGTLLIVREERRRRASFA
jgi:phosphatidylglycerol:prolipoprotein diacylglycerol transferase